MTALIVVPVREDGPDTHDGTVQLCEQCLNFGHTLVDREGDLVTHVELCGLRDGNLQ